MIMSVKWGFGLGTASISPRLEGLIDSDSCFVLDELGDLGVVVRRGAHVGIDILRHGAAREHHREDRGDDEYNELPFHDFLQLSLEVNFQKRPPVLSHPLS
jgi:hypothetical protein